MRRREVLSLIGSGAVVTAGCVGSDRGAEPATATSTETRASNRDTTSSPTSTTENTPTETETATKTSTTTETQTETETQTTVQYAGCAPTKVSGAETPGEGWPAVSVTGDPDPYDDMELTATVASQFTDDCPAAIEVELTNPTDSTLDERFGAAYPFTAYWNVGSQNGDPEINLVPIHRNGYVRIDSEDQRARVPTDAQDACWSVTVGGSYAVGASVEIPPGESVSETYKIFSSTHNDECLPPGDYRFVKDNYARRDESWGLTLSIGE